jgi:hypothetical protein
MNALSRRVHEWPLDASTEALLIAFAMFLIGVLLVAVLARVSRRRGG